MIKRKRKPWHRWVLLAAAAIELWSIWYGIQEYQRISSLQIFAVESFTVWASSNHLQRLLFGSLAATCLFYFFTWNVPPQSRHMYLLECIWVGLLIVAWIASLWLLPFHALPYKGQILWGIAALLLASLPGYSIWQYFKTKYILN